MTARNTAATLARRTSAVAFALLLVTSAALGGAFVFNEDVTSLEGASDEYVQRGAAFSPSDGLILGYASGAIETYQDLVGDNTPTDQLAGADWAETHKTIYQAHVTQKANNEVSFSILENYLNDTRSIALMNAKKTYVNQLNEGATKGEAEMAANDAIENYYSVKQRNLLSTWNANMEVLNNSLTQIRSSGHDKAAVQYVWDYSSAYTPDGRYPSSLGTTSVGLVNGESKQVTTFEDAVSGNIQKPTNFDGKIIQKDGIDGTELGNLVLLNGSRFADIWTSIQTQNSETQTQMQTFIDATYDNYQAGELNSSDFVDPYLGAREYSPETSDTWTLRTLSSMGVNPPENFSNIGRMNVTASGVTYTGVLMSDGVPAGGFTVGHTYNASQLGGPQWVALDSGGAQQLEGEFTLESATRADGPDYEVNESVTYRNLSYETANITELKELNNELNELQAQIDARQQTLRAGGGGPLSGLGTTAKIALAAAIGGALLMASKD